MLCDVLLPLILLQMVNTSSSRQYFMNHLNMEMSLAIGVPAFMYFQSHMIACIESMAEGPISAT